MKKVLFYFFTFIYVIGFDTAMCQHAVVQTNYPNDVKRTIVREYNYPATVSYVQTAVEHYFAYADATMAVTNCEISHDISVSDMELHGKYAYFCGYNTVSGTGVWGWFKVASLASGNLNYYIYDDFVCNNLYADSLFDLDVFEEKGQLHIVTVGSTTDGASKKKPCLIDITGTEGIATGWNYQMGLSECEGQLFNRLTRVCVTDNYIVAAGSTGSSFLYEGYRIHLRSSPFLVGGPQDSLYIFTENYSTSIPPCHQGEDMAMTHTQGDIFASAVYCFYNSSNTKYGVLVNVYDIAQVLSVYAASPVYSKYTHIPTVGNYSIVDLIYNKNNSSLYLLISGNVFGYTGSYISELPLPLPASFNIAFLQDIFLTSLDNYNSYQDILAQGYDGNNTQTSTYYTQPISTTPVCATPLSYNTSQPLYNKKSLHCPYTVCSASFDCSQIYQDKPMIIPNDVICIQP